MKSAWQIIEKKYPKIKCYGCATHQLNLVIKDILDFKEISDLAKNAKRIVKYFKNRYLPHEILARYQMKDKKKTQSLKMPCITRWGSHFRSFELLIDNRPQLLQAINEVPTPSDIKSKTKLVEVKQLIADTQFWTE